MSDSKKHPTGERLKQIAENEFNGNSADLARNLNMKPGGFNKYAQGNVLPGGIIAERLAKAGINLNWFYTGEGSMMIESEVEAPIKVTGSPVPKGEGYEFAEQVFAFNKETLAMYVAIITDTYMEEEVLTKLELLNHHIA